MAKNTKIITTDNQIACFVTNILIDLDRKAKRKVTAEKMEMLRKGLIRDIKKGCLDSAKDDYDDMLHIQAEIDAENISPQE